MRLPNSKDVVSAAALVNEVVAAFPYRSSRERACVTVQIHSDFHFNGSHVLFGQVLDNLIKNALRSLAAASTASAPGDLSIEVGAAKDRGRIVLTDRGIGMAEDLQARNLSTLLLDQPQHGSRPGAGLLPAGGARGQRDDPREVRATARCYVHT
jgi:two-component system CAI-1 autoinducer sensor kinase/phosphatase CqsS